MSDKAIFKNSGPLESISDCYKNEKMCNKTVDNYVHGLEFISDCCKTQ